MDRIESFLSQFPAMSNKPGFEIWFAVIIDYNTRKAIWVRYTTFKPGAGTPLKPSMIMWASFFDGLEPQNNCFTANRFDFEKLELNGNQYIFPSGTISPEKLTGKLSSPKGELSWDLDLLHKFEPLKYAPKIIENLGLAKTKAVITSPFARVNGEVNLAEKKFALNNAHGILTHLWGTSYIEDLIWIYVPQFDNDLDGWSLEIVSVRPKLFMPQFTFLILHQNGKVSHNGVLEALSSNVSSQFPQAEFKIKINDFQLKIKCKLNIEDAARYIYRDPDGSSRYIAHSDVSEVICQVEKSNFKKLLMCKNMSAVEFHSTKPWDNQKYFDPLQE
jgi:hypothetical protein